MAKINVYPIKSVLSYGDAGATINEESKTLLNSLSKMMGEDFRLCDLKDLGKGDLSLILVQSGGSENIFLKEIFPKFRGPYYLLTYGSSNSLAASLEILSFLRARNLSGEVLHGDTNYLSKRISALLKESKASRRYERMALIGKPSDWLIGSMVDEVSVQRTFGIQLIRIPTSKIVSKFSKLKDIEVPEELLKRRFPENEIKKAYGLYIVLKELVKDYGLTGLTIRCFDILGLVHSSACLALSLLNEEGIIATCEGDVPAMLSMRVVQKITGKHSFQANPNWIDPAKNEITLAHCTLPFDMASRVTFDTHFESGIGLGLHGEMNEGPVTIFKIDAALKRFYLAQGVLLRNEYRKDRCRTQIVLRMEKPVTYFLKEPLGNHHLVVYGHEALELRKAMIALGLKEVED